MHPAIFAIIDTETTGMRSHSDRVIEVGIVRVERGEIVRTYRTLINPGFPISPRITEMNGITNDDLVGAPSFEEVALDIEDMLKDAVFVAHNASFDYGFIKSEFRRLGMPFRAPVACSVKLSRALYPQQRGHSLDALIERFGFACESRHRAYDDALVVHEFIKRAERDHGKRAVADAIEEQLSGLGYGVPNKALRELPDTPGVYYFYDTDEKPIYIGKSKNIRTRVRSHFSDSAGEEHLRAGTVRVSVEETPGELSALLLESCRIKEELPLYNRALRKPKKHIIALERTTPEGYLTLDLSAEKTVDTKRDIVAIFRTMSQARTKLIEIAKENRLCEKLLGLERSGNACFGSQIEACDGACIGRESAESYNKRFKEAFRRRRIKTWPWKEAIVVEEKGTESSGAVFVVRDWRILASYVYEEGGAREFLPASLGFDYDTYKILARYLLDPSHRHDIRAITESEFARMKSELAGDYERSVS